MINFNLLKSILVASCLLVSVPSFSEIFENLKFNYNPTKGLINPTITTFTPSSGAAGTVVNITGTGFLTSSTVTIGGTNIAIEFTNATELKITIPCGLASGDLAVDGISAGVFTYISPTLSTSLGNISACVGTTFQIKNLAGTPSGTTFNWTNNNTSIGLITSQSNVTSIQTFIATNPTLEPISSIIIVTPTINGCLGEPKNYTITINPLPVVTPISNISVCAGVTINQINLSASSPTTGTGTSFSWNGNNNAAIGLSINSGITSPIPSFIASNTTNGLLTSNFTVIPTYQTCIGLPINFKIDVAPSSFGGVLSSDASICSGNTSGLLTLSGYKGAILNWESSTTGGVPWNSLATTTSSYQSGGLTQTTYYRVVVQYPGCPIAYSNMVTITVNSLPTITGNLSVCSGATNTSLNGSSTPASVNPWQSSIPGIATVSNLGVVTGISPGTTIITYTNSNGCSATANFVVNALPTAPTLSAIQPNCSVAAGTIQFYGLPTSGNWTIIPGSYNGSGATYTLNNQPAAVYNFSVRDSNLCSSASTSITVNTAPIIPATPTIGTITQPSCATTTGSVVLSGLPIGNWTITKSPGGQTYTNTGTTYTIPNLSSGTYTFSVSNGTCSSSSSQNVVIDATPIQSPPLVGLITQPTCTTSTGSVTLNSLPTGNWTLTRIPDGLTLTSSGISKAITGLASGTYNYTVTNSNGCISLISNDIIIDNQPASPPAPIAVAQSFLAAANATVSNLQIVSLGTPIWYANAVGGSAISGSTLLATGTYYVSKIVNSCESISRTAVNVTVFPTSSGGSVLGTTTVCSGTNSTILTLSGYTGSIQNWESSTVNDFSSNVITINNLSTTYTATNLIAPLYFRAVVQSGTVAYSSPAFIDVVAQSNGGNLSSSTAVCLGQNSGSLSVSGYTGTIIRWEQSINNGSVWSTISNTTSSYNPGSLTVTTKYRVVVQNGVCPVVTSTVATVTVKSTPTITDIPDQNVCYGNTVSFGNPLSTPGYTYEWSSLLGITPNPTTSDYSFTVTQSDDYTYTITNSSTGCFVSDSFSITVKPLPNATVISPTSICEGNSIYIGSNSTIGSTYSWTSIPSGFLSTNSNPSVNPVVTTTYILEETVTVTGCKKSNNVTITVQPEPTSAITTGPSIICETQSNVLIEATISNDYDAIAWEVVPANAGNLNIISDTRVEFTPTAAGILLGTVAVRHTLTNKCGVVQTPVNFPITIQKQAIANAGLSVSTCDSNCVQLNGSGSMNATTYAWTKPTNISGTLTPSNSVTPCYIASAADVANYTGPITFTLTVSSGSACSVNPPSTVNVTIVKKPVISAGTATTTICEDTTYKVSGATVDSNTASSSWKTSGDGWFTNEGSLSPTYHPGVTDIATGIVTITLEAIGNTPCSTITSQTVVNITKKPILNYSNQVVCGAVNTPITIEGSIQNAGKIEWSSTGAGSFDDISIPNPHYTPSPTDMNKTIILHMRVYNQNGCDTSLYTDKYFNFTINAQPIVSAGINETICEGQTYKLDTASSSNASITWSATSGTFNDANEINPTFTPNASDTSVTLTITGTQPGCTTPATDTMVLTIQKKPTVTADNGLPQVICQGDTFYFNASAPDSASVLWQRVSSGSGGILNNPNSISASYVSDTNEAGTVTFSLTANPFPACTNPAITTTNITIIAKPTVSFDVITAADKVICEGLNYVENSANATNFSSLAWSTNGDGDFISGAATLTPTYEPGTLDKSNGTVILTLKALNNAPCIAFAEDSIELTITKNPIVTVVNTRLDVCTGAGVPVPISGPGVVFGINATNYDGNLNWESSLGHNGFLVQNPLNTTVLNSYTPSASDIDNGSVSLTLTASRLSTNCNILDEKTILLEFIKAPQVDAGPTTVTICENGNYTSTSATAINTTNVTWSSNGSAGTIANPTLLKGMVYSPSAIDVATGSVTLTLTGVGNSCQDPISDDIFISFEKLPVITAVGTATICKNSPSWPIIRPSVTNNYQPITLANWTSSGTGTFAASGDSLAPIYTPTDADKSSGQVTLTLTVYPIAPCSTPQIGTIILDIIPEPVASAGVNLNQCETPFTLAATATAGTYSSLNWSTNSNGTFVGGIINSLNPTYTPSATDITNGTVDLTLTANPISPCTVPLATTITVSITTLPDITTSTQATICEDASNVEVLNTTIINAASFTYKSATGTIINNPSSLNPTVTPSLADISNGFITLTIEARPLSNCGTTLVTKDITIPIVRNPLVRGGTLQTICEGANITTIDAAATYVDIAGLKLQWSSIGDGTFITSPNNIVTTYKPGATEIANGSVNLKLTGTASSPCVNNSVSTLIYTITKKPTLTVIPAIVPICEDAIYKVQPGQLSVTNLSSVANISWNASSPLTIVSTGPLDLEPTFKPSAADVINGHSILTVTLTPIAPCATPIVGTIRVNISKNATIDATQADYTFCENKPKQLTAVFANHDTTTILWRIVSGAGTLNPANSAAPIFTPDASRTTVLIEVSVSSNSPCTAVTTKQFKLNVIKKPIVTFAKTTTTICNTLTSFPLDATTVDATVANATTNTTYKWTTTGTGNFANDTAITLPINYNFSAADLLSNLVKLRLTAYADPLCSTLSTYDEITINITKAPTVVTAPIGSVCQGSEFTATATATDNSSVLWSTVGTSNGLFGSANQPVTQYTPGTHDINSFTLQVTALANAPCAALSATKTVTIQQKPTIDAGIEIRTNCSSEPFEISGVIPANTGSLTWSSNSSSGVNSGTFSDPTAKNPAYTPSAAEIAAGSPIILTVTAQAVAPCTDVVSDFIVLNLTPNQVVNAGLNQTICEGSKVSLAGSATNSSIVNWTSSGDGAFSVPNSLTSDYIPGTSDLINGTVTLTLHAISDTNCPEVTDSTVITIVKKPTADAGANVSICEGSSYTLSAGEASAQNYASISWSATGPGALDLSTINTLTPTYNPAPRQTGIVTLTLTATGYSECGIDKISSKTITIVAKPIVSISPPSTITICQGEPLSITNVDAKNYSALTWTSSNGLGSFAPNNSKATTYTPLANQSSTVTLKLTATALNAVCTNTFSEVAVTIIPSPIVNAGLDASICETATHTISGASAPLGAIFNWTITGPATISSGSQTLTPVITPNPGASGAVTLTLTVQGTLQCPIDVSDSVTITVFPEPTVDTGINQTACEGVAFISLSGTATNGSSYVWTTNGSGSIQSSINPLQAKYNPGSSDYIDPSGVTTITNFLTAIGANGCSNVVKSMTLTLYAKPKVYAGIDVTTCQNSSVTIANTIANNFSALTWSTSGDGIFDYSSSNGGKTPTYKLGPNDLSTVTLTMHAMPNENCSAVEVTDQMVITVQKNPTIVATKTEITMCAEAITLPDLITVNNANSILWTNTTLVSDKSIIINPNLETPNFTPSAAEIANGFALLTVTAEPLSECSDIVSQVIKVILIPKLTILDVNAGDNKEFCQGSAIILNNGATTSAVNYNWTENGTGTIKALTEKTLHPEYIPGINETGVVTLTLHAVNPSTSPCSGEVMDTMTVTIKPNPIVIAGTPFTVCAGSNASLGSATKSNSDTIEWSSSTSNNGTSISGYVGGTFIGTDINPTYVPSQNDIDLGYVFLTVKATNTSCIGFVTDFVKVTIAPGVGVSAGVNGFICEGTTFALSSANSNATTVAWTSSQNEDGTSISTYSHGQFLPINSVNPSYTPSNDDITRGYVFLTITGTGNSTCSINKNTIRLNIVKKPIVSNTDVQMCMSTPQIILNGVATNYQSLYWSVYSGPGSISLDAANPLHPTFISNVSGLTTEQNSVVRLLVNPNPGCPQSAAVYSDLHIKIQPLPTVKAGDNGAVCNISGQPIALFTINGTSVTNASSQDWTSSGPGLFTLGNLVLFQSLSSSCTSETLTLTAKGIGACSTETVSDYVTLKINCTPPSLGTIVGTSTLCQGTSSVLYKVAFDSNIQTYNWQVPTGATIVSGQGSNSITVDYGANAVSGNVSVNGINSCGSVISTLPITINALPTGTTITGAQTVCTGATNVVYLAAAIANASIYTWSVPSGVTILSGQGTNSIQVLITSTATSGNVSIIGNNTCGSGTVSSALPIIINPQPSMSSSLTPTAICSKLVFNYFPTSETLGTTFTWTRAVQNGISNPAGFGSSSINEILVNTTPNVVSVSYQITTTTTEGCTNTQTVIETVNPSPSLNNSSTPPAGICSEASFNYTPTSATGTVTWIRKTVSGIVELASSGSGQINEVLTNSTPLPISVTYELTIPANTYLCTNTSSANIQLIVNPIPQVSVNNATICAGSSATLTAAPSLAGTYSYAWTVPAGVSNPGNVASFSATIAGTYSVVITNTATNCISSSASGIVTVNPLPVVTVNNATICAGSSATLIAAPSTAGTYSYAWTVPAGVSNAGNTASFSATVAGTYMVIITNTVTNCSSVSASGTLTVNPIPTLSITNPSPVCVPNTVDITTTTTGSSLGLIYTYWNNSATTIAIANPTTISTSGTYYIKTTNTFGCTDSKPVTVVINPLPSATISGQNNFVVCQNGTQPILTFTGSNGTPPYNFNYQIGSGLIQRVATLGSSNSASVAIPPSVFGNYTITLLSVQDSSSSSCISSAIDLPNSAHVDVQQVGTITPVDQNLISPIICQGSPITPVIFTIGGSSTSAFVTNLPSGLNGVFNSTSSKLTISGTPTTLGIYNYIVTTSGSLNGCNSTYSGGTITVNSNDVITLLTTNTAIQNVCASAAIQPITYNLGGGATGGTVTFSPHQPTGISWNLVSKVITISGTPSEVGAFTYTVNSFGICDPNTYSGTITINNIPTLELVSGNSTPTVCAGTSLATIKYKISPSTATFVLTDKLPTGITFNSATGIISGTPTESGSFPYTISASSGCGNAFSGAITVNPNQSILYLSGNKDQVACVNNAIDPIEYSVASGITGVVVNPALPNGITAVLNISTNKLIISGIPTVGTSLPQNYSITTQGTCSPAAITSITFDIKAAASINFSSSITSLNQSVCQNASIVPITFTVGGGARGIVLPTLPAGVTIAEVSGVYTISGNPTFNGTVIIPITTKGCTITENITLSNVNSVVSIDLSSAKGTDNQTQCQLVTNSAIVPIKYSLIGATGVKLNNLPNGVVHTYNSVTGELIISGIPTASGIFNYTVTTLPCAIVKTAVLKISTPISITNELVMDVTCSIINDGAISVKILGGVTTSRGFYAIHWAGPNGFQQNLMSISGLEAGQYTISGKDAIGCPLPTKTYPVLPAQPIIISLVSTTNVTCSNSLGCANFDFTGGDGIFTFTLQYLDPNSPLNPKIVAQNNYYNLCNLKAGVYNLIVADSKNCSTEYLFTIYDYSSLKIDAVSLDTTLCVDNAGKVRVTMSSLDSNLSFYYNSTLVPNVNLGNNVYELAIANPTALGIIKVINSQNCSDTETVTTSLTDTTFDFTSLFLTTDETISVNESVAFTNGLSALTIPVEYNYITWDFGDYSPYKVFYNPKDINPNSSGESISAVFHTYAIDGLYPVTLTAYNHFGCSRSITKILTVGQGAAIIAPTAFSPNNDGINDLFRPSLIGLKEVNMYLYDTFGNLIYEFSSNDITSLPTDWGWNGIEKSNSIPVNGTYRYFITSKTINDKIIEKEGQFLLIK